MPDADIRHTEAREYVFLRTGRVPLWRVAVAIAVALALAILVSGLFLILLPVIVVGVLAARFLGRRVPPPRTDVIETEYEVIEEKRSGEKPAINSERRS
ncbi:MAG: hypothetical protein FJX37_09590 [Alphaproteobacteria bacterium]|nr:hypothetical protein [Alphaproteobacteria bacterium]MBM3733917.1 hypothetical protein [Acidimicrobiia bacterium]